MLAGRGRVSWGSVMRLGSQKLAQDSISSEYSRMPGSLFYTKYFASLNKQHFTFSPLIEGN